jgi:palmitoyltransferase
MLRRQGGAAPVVTAELVDSDEEADSKDAYDEDDALAEAEVTAQPEWRNHEGDRLRDFGVDEETEILEEEEVPLRELLRRHSARTNASS